MTDEHSKTRPRSAPDAVTPIEPIEAKLVGALPGDAGWQFEPKWDGFRCIATKAGGVVKLFAKSGKPLGRYFPDVVEGLAAIEAETFVLDGELVIPVGKILSFDALQMRLHPAASRVRKLAAETPAMLIGFDMLQAPDGTDLKPFPLATRRARLEKFIHAANSPTLILSPVTSDRRQAERWLARTGSSLDGVVAKRIDGPYEPGARTMLKVKRIRTADCVVGGFRYGTDSKFVGSMLLGLFDAEGRLNHVGFSAAIARADRPALTQKLEAIRGEPGFTGKAPGGPSRWSTERTEQYEPLRHELVVEVLYDQVTGDRLRHGATFVRWRPDKAPRQCTMEQLQAEALPDDIWQQAIRR